MLARIQARLHVFPRLLRLRRLERVECGIRLVEHELHHGGGKLVVLVLDGDLEHAFLVAVEAEVLAELLQQVGMEVAVELVVLDKVELVDDHVVELPRIEDSPHGVRVVIAERKTEKRTEAARSPAQKAAQTLEARLRCRGGSDNRLGTVRGLDYPHHEGEHRERRYNHDRGAQPKVPQVAVDEPEADFDKS